MTNKKIKAEIINIGDELLCGQTINTNGAFIAQILRSIGIDTQKIIVIKDNKIAIEKAVNAGLESADIVFITGGLGTTNDDITKQSISEIFGCPLEENLLALQQIKATCEAFHIKCTKSILWQALLPKGCVPIENPVGIAPGIWLNVSNKVLICTPGVPSEMKSMMTQHIKNQLITHFKPPFICDRYLKCFGIPEAMLSDKLQLFEQNLPPNISLAYLPSMGMITLRLSGYADRSTELEQIMQQQIDNLKSIINEYIVSEGEADFPTLIQHLLVSKKKTLSTAESCTGGYIAHLLTSIAGASQYFKGAVVAYDNQIKQNILSVPQEILENYGAVSEQTVVIMAEQVRKLYQTDYAISVSGIAGPGGGSKEKPVGTVWIAVASENQTIARCFSMGKTRENVICRTAQRSFYMLWQLINENK